MSNIAPPPTRAAWMQVCGGLTIAWILPELDLGRWAGTGNGDAATLLREACWWVYAAVLVAYVLRVERKPLASIGMRRPNWKTPVFGVLAAIVMIATVVLSYNVIFPLLGLQMNRTAVDKITHHPQWVQLLIFARAAVVEEILYRGYPIERIQQLTGSKWIAFVVSAVVFILAHLAGWGGAQLIVVTFGAVILGLLYLWRRDLVCNMVAHFLVDAVSFANT
ncbi:MAG: CPBP family intramembrane glutamic endopeptidase [Casimicrobiaceae bacterium]